MATTANKGTTRDLAVPFWTYDALEDVTQDRVFLVHGGFNSGKTFGASIWFLNSVFRNRDSSMSWAVAQTHSKVRDILIDTFVTVLHEVFGLQAGRDFEVSISSPARISFKGMRHTIYLHSGTRPDLMVGSNIASYLITEAALQKREVFLRCESRARCPRAKVVQGMLESTPEGFNWFYDMANFEGAVNPEKNYRRWQLHTTDNPSIRPGYVQKIERAFGHDKNRLRSYLYGEFLPFTHGTAYWEFVHSRNVLVDKPAVASPFLPLVFSWDLGVNPLAWIVIQRQPHQGSPFSERTFRYVALEECELKPKSIVEACAEFRVKFPLHEFRDTEIDIDGGHDGHTSDYSSGKSFYRMIEETLRDYGYRRVHVRAARSAPHHETSFNQVAMLMAYGHYVVNPHLTNLIRSHTESAFRPGTWELDKPRGTEENGTPKDPTHFGDAARAALFRLTQDIDIATLTDNRVLGTTL